MAKTLLVTIDHVGRIPLICGDGPILVPMRVSSQMLNKLVMSGYRVYEHNPNNIHQKVRVTRSNLNEDRFPPVVPKPEVHPVGKEIPTVNLAPDAPSVKEESVEEEKSAETVEASKSEASETANSQTAQAPIFDKYAGLSRNQRKRLRQQEAAAKAAAEKESETPSNQ